MDDWEKINKTSLPQKEEFYSHLNMEDITDVDSKRAKKNFKFFKLKTLDEYQNLYSQSDTLLLADVFNNFQNVCLKIYGLDLAIFLLAPGLVWQTALKNTQ